MTLCILLKGAAASGKSTWAQSWVEAHPDCKRVSKDYIRRMLDCGKWTTEKEDLVCAVRDATIHTCLEMGYSVVVDNCNLDPRHEKRIRELVGSRADIRIQDLTHVPMEVCMARDDRRPSGERVGRETIVRMYEQYIFPQEGH